MPELYEHIPKPQIKQVAGVSYVSIEDIPISQEFYETYAGFPRTITSFSLVDLSPREAGIYVDIKNLRLDEAVQSATMEYALFKNRPDIFLKVAFGQTMPKEAEGYKFDETYLKNLFQLMEQGGYKKIVLVRGHGGGDGKVGEKNPVYPRVGYQELISEFDSPDTVIWMANCHSPSNEMPQAEHSMIIHAEGDAGLITRDYATKIVMPKSADKKKE